VPYDLYDNKDGAYLLQRGSEETLRALLHKLADSDRDSEAYEYGDLIIYHNGNRLMRGAVGDLEYRSLPADAPHMDLDEGDEQRDLGKRGKR